LIMSCHDEIGLSKKHDPEVSRIIQHEYTNFNSDNSPIRMKVPIIASCKEGLNWWEACKD
jgi:hypothetical protein